MGRRKTGVRGEAAPGGDVLAGARQRGDEPLLVERLEQVVERADAERVERVPLERGDEDDRRRRRAADGAGDVEPVERRHLDVEEDEVGVLARDRLQRGGAVVALADEVDVRMRGEERAQPPAGQRLVVDDERADRRRAHDGPSTGGPPAAGGRLCARRRGSSRVHTVPPPGRSTSANVWSSP